MNSNEEDSTLRFDAYPSGIYVDPDGTVSLDACRRDDVVTIKTGALVDDGVFRISGHGSYFEPDGLLTSQAHGVATFDEPSRIHIGQDGAVRFEADPQDHGITFRTGALVDDGVFRISGHGSYFEPADGLLTNQAHGVFTTTNPNAMMCGQDGMVRFDACPQNDGIRTGGLVDDGVFRISGHGSYFEPADGLLTSQGHGVFTTTNPNAMMCGQDGVFRISGHGSYFEPAEGLLTSQGHGVFTFDDPTRMRVGTTDLFTNDNLFSGSIYPTVTRSVTIEQVVFETGRSEREIIRMIDDRLRHHGLDTLPEKLDDIRYRLDALCTDIDLPRELIVDRIIDLTADLGFTLAGVFINPLFAVVPHAVRLIHSIGPKKRL